METRFSDAGDKGALRSRRLQWRSRFLDSRFRGNDEGEKSGMTSGEIGNGELRNRE